VSTSQRPARRPRDSPQMTPSTDARHDVGDRARRSKPRETSGALATAASVLSSRYGTSTRRWRRGRVLDPSRSLALPPVRRRPLGDLGRVQRAHDGKKRPPRRRSPLLRLDVRRRVLDERTPSTRTEGNRRSPGVRPAPAPRPYVAVPGDHGATDHRGGVPATSLGPRISGNHSRCPPPTPTTPSTSPELGDHQPVPTRHAITGPLARDSPTVPGQPFVGKEHASNRTKASGRSLAARQFRDGE